MKLCDLVFSDLFVADDATTSWFKATPDSLSTQPIPPGCEDELTELRSHLNSRKGNSDFRVDWPDASGLRLRIKRIHVADSKVIYICRRFRELPGKLASLGMPTGIATRLLASELTEGLVIFFGKAGSGKTTTASSFISERLSQFGGVCWTIENPIELPLQGKHGKGWCYQTEASSDEEIGPAVRDMMRATPNIISIGELRDGLSVREAITAATSGHLVVATFHAADLLSGIARLARLAGDENASAGIADALRVAIHLSLRNEEPKPALSAHTDSATDLKGTSTPARVLVVEPLWISGQEEDGLRSMIRDGDFHLLKSETERQRRNFLMNKLP